MLAVLSNTTPISAAAKDSIKNSRRMFISSRQSSFGIRRAELEGYECIRNRQPAANRRPARCRDDDVLRAVLPHVCHRRRMATRRQRCRPQFCASLGVKGAESTIVGGGDEN